MLFENEILIQVILLVVISGVTYLPKIGQLQYFKDDWYYVLDGLYGGPAIFNEMFSIDRPARGLFYQAYFSLFGANPLPYHLGHLFWRLSSALIALWLFRMIWPQRSQMAFLGSLFFLVYPGYLWWTSGIEYQPMAASLFLQILSFALTVKAIFTQKSYQKAVFALGGMVTGWVYLMLVDYAIGMEFFRLALIFLAVGRKRNLSFLRKAFETGKVWFFSSFLIPAGFIFWKIFLFHGERKATNLSMQLAPFLEAPRQVLKSWFVGLVRDGLSVSVLAWIEPFSQSFWSLSQNEIIFGLLYTGLLIIVLFTVKKLFIENLINKEINAPLLIGFVSCFFGVLPVVMANRFIDFGPYSHYSLPISISSALFLASLVAFIKPGKMQFVFISLVLGAAVLTHNTLAISTVNEVNIINSFWWQMYWRSPQIREGTTLVIDYPALGYDDETDNVWGPANLLYYPENKQLSFPVRYPLAALPPNSPKLENVILKGEEKDGYRTHYFWYRDDQIVVLSQPIQGSCVRVLDGNLAILSSYDIPDIRKVAFYSRPENLLVDSPDLPPSAAFGEEPEHGWCYFYQKINLAIQQGKWETALSLASEVRDHDLFPIDPVEWMPFLLTYAVFDDIDSMATVARKIKKDEGLEVQVCDMVELYSQVMQLSQDMVNSMHVMFCGGRK